MSIRTLLRISLIIILGGCTPILITHDVGTNVDFTRYKTFYCQECLDDFNPLSKEYDNEANRELIRNALRYELEKLGYKYQRDNPDFTVDFHVVIEQRLDVVREECPSNWEWESHDFYRIPSITNMVHLLSIW